jgi:hypothetical protein
MKVPKPTAKGVSMGHHDTKRGISRYRMKLSRIGFIKTMEFFA